jgi:hypothetical protein
MLKKCGSCLVAAYTIWNSNVLHTRNNIGNLSQFQSGKNKSHMDCPEIKPGLAW